MLPLFQILLMLPPPTAAYTTAHILLLVSLAIQYALLYATGLLEGAVDLHGLYIASFYQKADINAHLHLLCHLNDSLSEITAPPRMDYSAEEAAAHPVVISCRVHIRTMDRQDNLSQNLHLIDCLKQAMRCLWTADHMLDAVSPEWSNSLWLSSRGRSRGSTGRFQTVDRTRQWQGVSEAMKTFIENNTATDEHFEMDSIIAVQFIETLNYHP